jgi:hypothetical protein
MEDFRKGFEDDSLVSILELKLVACKVLILAIHNLHLNVIPEALLEVFVAANIQLDIPKVFNTPGLILDIDA